MKKPVILFLLIVMVLLCFSACWPRLPNSVYKSDHPELFSVAVNSVLGIEASKWDKMEILETDPEGRVLFKYYSNIKAFPDEYLFILLICQKSDEIYSYYYDDYCFFIFRNESDITNEQIVKLKEMNDWNKELNDEKLTKVKSSFDQLICSDERNKALNEKFKSYFIPQEGHKYFFYPITIDQDGKQLFFIRNFKLQTGNDTVGYFETYIMILNEDDTFNEDTFLQKLDDEYNYQEQLHDFKKLNNWNQTDEGQENSYKFIQQNALNKALLSPHMLFLMWNILQRK